MENLMLPSPLFLIWDVKRAIEKNTSIQIGIKKFLQRGLQDSFSVKVSKWSEDTHKIAVQRQLIDYQFSTYQESLMYVLSLGVSGQSIYENLCMIESEYVQMCEEDIQVHIAKLPLLMQIPLIFLIFPAIAMILLVPALSQLSF